ncbi:MAG: hypothetical protein ABIJ97_16640 [Bacteroidota bacterium]
MKSLLECPWNLGLGIWVFSCHLRAFFSNQKSKIVNHISQIKTQETKIQDPESRIKNEKFIRMPLEFGTWNLGLFLSSSCFFFKSEGLPAVSKKVQAERGHCFSTKNTKLPQSCSKKKKTNIEI